MNEERNYVIEKKKSPILIFMVILTCIVIIGTCIYFIYNSIKLDNDNSNKEENNVNSSEAEEDNITNEEEQELEITEEDKVLAQELVDNFNFYKDYNFSGTSFGYIYNIDKLSINNISNSTILEIAFSNLYKELFFSKLESINYQISPKIVKKYVVSIFGNVNYTNDNISKHKCFGIVTYNAAENQYTYKPPACGGVFLPNIVGKIVDIKKYADRIEIIEKIIYSEYEELDNCMTPPYYLVYYNHPTEKVLIESPNCENRNMNPIDIINNNIDKLLSYKWTFKKDGSNYYFEKIERMN